MISTICVNSTRAASSCLMVGGRQVQWNCAMLMPSLVCSVYWPVCLWAVGWLYMVGDLLLSVQFKMIFKVLRVDWYFQIFCVNCTGMLDPNERDVPQLTMNIVCSQHVTVLCSGKQHHVFATIVTAYKWSVLRHGVVCIVDVTLCVYVQSLYWRTLTSSNLPLLWRIQSFILCFI